MSKQRKQQSSLPFILQGLFIHFSMYMCVPAWVYMHHMPVEARKGHQSLGTGAVSNYVGDGN